MALPWNALLRPGLIRWIFWRRTAGIYGRDPEDQRGTEYYTNKVAIVKYDAFKEMGGKLSFALAMLDKENNGFVMNAIHSSDGCYTYVKEIVKGESYVVLGEEEKEALRQAVNSHNELEQVKTLKRPGKISKKGALRELKNRV